jgi:hypothetical protein
MRYVPERMVALLDGLGVDVCAGAFDEPAERLRELVWCWSDLAERLAVIIVGVVSVHMLAWRWGLRDRLGIQR